MKISPKMVERWNPETHRYEPYTLPIGAVLMADLGDTVACANCGKEMKYDESNSSFEIQNWCGLGLAVCPECHQKEIERKLKYEPY